MASEYLFTSESVSEGHPDKVADQISDAVLDACLEQDPLSRVAAETLCTTGLVVLAGEITTNANVDYIGLTRDVLKRIGYDNTEYGIDHKGCSVLVGYDKQSQDIAQGVDHAADDELNLGAGDQGLMFGYACDETPTLMPAPIYYAHRLVERQSIVRKNGTMSSLRPDAKSQVTLRYRDGKPVGCDTIVLSTQHAPEMSDGKKMKPEFIEAVVENIIRPVMPAEWLKDTRFLINPTGRFVVGGPQGDCGLTGRKIIVDTYGGYCPHGLRLPLCCQEHRGRWSRPSVPGSGCLRHRRCRTDEHHRLHERHWCHPRQQDRRTRSRSLRPASARHHQDA